MSSDNPRSASQAADIGALLKSDTYRHNVEFWERAWGMVKAAYTQLPDLPYITAIPEGLERSGARRVLDLGCGSGWLSIYLARAGFLVAGIDVAAHAIELAQSWANNEGLEIQFDCGDIGDLPYPPGSFDAIVANSIFEHLTYDLAAATLARLKTILVPGGTFFGCFDKVGGGPGKYYALTDGTHVYTDKGRRGMMLRYFADEELKTLFAGWTITSIHTTDSGSRIIWARS
jgi:SAM-dependent methyltransferase